MFVGRDQARQQRCKAFLINGCRRAIPGYARYMLERAGLKEDKHVIEQRIIVDQLESLAVR